MGVFLDTGAMEPISPSSFLLPGSDSMLACSTSQSFQVKFKNRPLSPAESAAALFKFHDKMRLQRWIRPKCIPLCESKGLMNDFAASDCRRFHSGDYPASPSVKIKPLFGAKCWSLCWLRFYSAHLQSVQCLSHVQHHDTNVLLQPKHRVTWWILIT